MSTESAEAFVTRIVSDEAFRKQLLENWDGDYDWFDAFTFHTVAATHGYTMTGIELVQAFTSDPRAYEVFYQEMEALDFDWGELELSDSELELVAGGTAADVAGPSTPGVPPEQDK